MYRLLLVDDERIIVDSLYGYLKEQLDIEIHRAYSAFEALSILKQTRFDIVITDISMPGMDGLELLAYIKKHWPACGVIMLTGYDDFSYAYQAFQFKETDFILKVEPYATIRKAVEDRLAALEQDRQQMAFIELLGERVTQMLPLIRRDTLARTLRYGDALPGREDLAHMGLALVPEADVLLAVGEVLAEGMQPRRVYEQQQRAVMMVEQSMRERGLACTAHLDDQGIAWLIQRGPHTEQEPAAELAGYVRETLYDVPARLAMPDGGALRLAVCDRFVGWPRLPAAYAAARLQLSRLQGGGVAVAQGGADDGQVPFPPLGALERLAQLYRQGARDAFLREAALYLAPLCQARDFAAAQPSPILAGLCVLVGEVLQSMDIRQWPDSRWAQVLSGGGYTDGARWGQDALRLLEALFALREAEQDRQRGWLVEEINAYLHAHYMDDLSLSTLAHHVHYNPSYLSRVYREATGEKLMTYLTQVRIGHAKRRLAQSADKVADIARACGFFSMKYFIQAFKRETGMTPNGYRQAAREGGAADARP